MTRTKTVHQESLGVLTRPSRPAAGSWWTSLDREAFGQEASRQAARMHGSQEERKAGAWSAPVRRSSTR